MLLLFFHAKSCAYLLKRRQVVAFENMECGGPKAGGATRHRFEMSRRRNGRTVRATASSRLILKRCQATALHSFSIDGQQTDTPLLAAGMFCLSLLSRPRRHLWKRLVEHTAIDVKSYKKVMLFRYRSQLFCITHLFSFLPNKRSATASMCSGPPGW